jgi:glucokinase
MASLVLALDLGGSRLRAAAVDADGKLHHREEVATTSLNGTKAITDRMIAMSRSVLDKCAGEDILGVGVSSAGPLDSEAGFIVSISTIPNFFDVPIVAILEDALNLQVTLENDAIAAAVGEWTHGAGRGVRSLVYVTVSTGLGGGLIIDGNVLHGRRGFAGHIGHMSIIADGRTCGCGNRGCWEAYASGTSFTTRARERVAQAPNSSVALKGDTLSAADVFAAARTGDELAQQLVDEQADLLGIGMVSLLHLFSPERIIMGGGLSHAFDQLHPGIKARIERGAMPAFRDVPVLRAACGDDAGLIGAAMTVFRRNS